ncbi:aminotransferase class V-fold PLP-dependent enzyme [Granulosicoccus antarcticus]|uniref:Cysteine desulfurase n=1 Tax=Granulosicoccus antarcticus IMCC3135 TaxID=1192854 RepID=A0A2Z2NWI8_9GAMM|nr:SufS family cysteine desulfurase [Granulosicoccus antarcticus]ASJ75792.1 Cysteine desulfurase SufS [Granulosicoccus antarcticus IMCC3135]
MSFDVQTLRAQFPILSTQVNGKPLIYLDNAATTQKPQVMIDALVGFYTQCNANVHRGAHALSDEATRRFENARNSVLTFMNATRREEVIWTKGTTEALNLVANGLSKKLEKNDEIVVTEMEHHANLVTWQQACEASGALLKVARISDSGELDMEHFESLLSERTRFVAFPHASNALGTLNPITAMTAMVKSRGDALVLVDGAQGIAHCEVDVQAIGCDFYAFSGHKLFGPTGIGVLWGRYDVLETWPVWQTGGEMISTVDYQHATWGELPYRLEAGTPNIAGAIGLGAAVEWFTKQDFAALRQHESEVLKYAMELGSEFPGMTLVGTAREKVGVMSFLVDGTHPGDLGFILDQQGVAIRTGDHCAQPLMKRLGVGGTARVSLSIYNTVEDIDALFVALKKAQQMLT